MPKGTPLDERSWVLMIASRRKRGAASAGQAQTLYVRAADPLAAIQAAHEQARVAGLRRVEVISLEPGEGELPGNLRALLLKGTSHEEVKALFIACMDAWEAALLEQGQDEHEARRAIFCALGSRLIAQRALSQIEGSNT